MPLMARLYYMDWHRLSSCLIQNKTMMLMIVKTNQKKKRREKKKRRKKRKKTRMMIATEIMQWITTKTRLRFTRTHTLS